MKRIPYAPYSLMTPADRNNVFEPGKYATGQFFHSLKYRWGK